MACCGSDGGLRDNGKTGRGVVIGISMGHDEAKNQRIEVIDSWNNLTSGADIRRR